MTWQSPSAGLFERPLNTQERFFSLISAKPGDPKENLSITAWIKVSFSPCVSDPAAALRRAWKQMRFQYPEIAATLTATSKIYKVIDDEAADRWVSSTFFVDDAAACGHDVFRSFGAGPVTTLHYLPKPSELLIHAPHSLTDGTSSFRMLSHVLQAVVEPQPVQFGTEYANLFPDPETIAQLKGGPEGLEPGQKAFGEIVKAMPSVGIEADEVLGTKAPATGRIGFELDTQTSAAVWAACKVRGLSVTAALFAAVVKATPAFASEQMRDRDYVSAPRIDMRPALPPPYDTAAYPVNSWVFSLPWTGSAKRSFESLAEELAGFFGEKDLRARTTICLRGFLGTIIEYVKGMKEGEARLDAQPTLNSVGKVDRYFEGGYGGTLGVVDAWFASEQLGPATEVYSWSFGGRIRVSSCYSEIFYSEKLMQGFMDSVKAILLEGLRVA